ncbi:MAG: TRAP transporter small permease subunit [Neomegalonema sp.]|nr:TRAP transporter small permease subunit [Neomegalonema sp.]
MLALARTRAIFARLLVQGAGALLVFLLAMQIGQIIARTLFSVSLIALEEGIVFLHGLTLLAGCLYALVRNRHVRLDLGTAPPALPAPPAPPARAERAMTLLLGLPAAGLLLWASLPAARFAILTLEGSADPAGLPLVFVLKGAIALFALLLLLLLASSLLAPFTEQE